MKVAVVFIALTLLLPVAVQAHVPMPDSAVGKHQPIKPIRKGGNWAIVHVKGYSGLWRCYFPANYKWPAPVKCKRAS